MSNAKRGLQKLYGFLGVPLWAVCIGFALGNLDITRTDGLVDLGMFAAAVVLGYLQPITSPLSALILTWSLYTVHVFAIQHGVKQPYVELSVGYAADCWFYLIPNTFWALIGVVVRVLTNIGRPWNSKE